jgi:hypothetical protein
VLGYGLGSFHSVGTFVVRAKNRLVLDCNFIYYIEHAQMKAMNQLCLELRIVSEQGTFVESLTTHCWH